MNSRSTPCKTRPWTGAVLLTALLGLIACGGEPPEAPDADEDEAERQLVEAESPQKDEVTGSHRSTATLQAMVDTRVIARTRGVVEELHVEEGDRVDAGDVLAVLDDRQWRLEREERQAQVDELEQQYRQERSLVEDGIESEEAAQRTRFQLEAERARLALAELNLDETRIRAPVDGVVSDRGVREGDHLNDGDEAFRVTNPDQLEAEVHVPQRLVHRIRPGQSVEVRSDGLDEVFTGRVIRIAPVVDEESGTVRTTVHLDAREAPLRPGSFARLRIAHDTREDALLVPRRALRFGNGGSSLFVVEDGKAQQRDVETGHEEGEWIEITAGLDAGDKVVTFGHETLREGSAVKVLDPDERLAGREEAPPADDR